MLEDLKLFAMAQKSMDWLARRQEVLSENIANANTANYQAKDLKPLSFKNLLTKDETLHATTTNAMHISPAVEPASVEIVKERNPDESKPNGNSVLLEEQMEKMGDVKGKYELAINLFTKNLTMLKEAIGKGSSS